MTDLEHLCQLTDSEEYRQARARLEEEHTALMRLSIQERNEIILQLVSGRPLLVLIEAHLASRNNRQDRAVAGLAESRPKILPAIIGSLCRVNEEYGI